MHFHLNIFGGSWRFKVEKLSARTLEGWPDPGQNRKTLPSFQDYV